MLHYRLFGLYDGGDGDVGEMCVAWMSLRNIKYSDNGGYLCENKLQIVYCCPQAYSTEKDAFDSQVREVVHPSKR